METDRQLLEQVAKVIGIPIAFGGPDADICRRTDTWVLWNPLTDDGDALRLAARLQINLNWRTNINGTFVYANHEPEEVLQDSDLATRRAIVRAACNYKTIYT
jgi:hypothetical protein